MPKAHRISAALAGGEDGPETWKHRNRVVEDGEHALDKAANGSGPKHRRKTYDGAGSVLLPFGRSSCFVPWSFGICARKIWKEKQKGLGRKRDAQMMQVFKGEVRLINGSRLQSARGPGQCRRRGCGACAGSHSMARKGVRWGKGKRMSPGIDARVGVTSEDKRQKTGGRGVWIRKFGWHNGYGYASKDVEQRPNAVSLPSTRAVG